MAGTMSYGQYQNMMKEVTDKSKPYTTDTIKKRMKKKKKKEDETKNYDYS